MIDSWAYFWREAVRISYQAILSLIGSILVLGYPRSAAQIRFELSTINIYIVHYRQFKSNCNRIERRYPFR